MEFEKIGATSLTESIYKSLLGKILSGAWKPGNFLPAERDIADQMGVSRSSLHHAVLQLERDGFVHVLPRRGTQVADYRKKPTPQSLSAIMAYGSEELDEPLFYDLMDIRRLVEMECARRACDNIYPSTLREIQCAGGGSERGRGHAERTAGPHRTGGQGGRGRVRRAPAGQGRPCPGTQIQRIMISGKRRRTGAFVVLSKFAPKFLSGGNAGR